MFTIVFLDEGYKMFSHNTTFIVTLGIYNRT